MISDTIDNYFRSKNQIIEQFKIDVNSFNHNIIFEDKRNVNWRLKQEERTVLISEIVNKKLETYPVSGCYYGDWIYSCYQYTIIEIAEEDTLRTFWIFDTNKIDNTLEFDETNSENTKDNKEGE